MVAFTSRASSAASIAPSDPLEVTAAQPCPVRRGFVNADPRDNLLGSLSRTGRRSLGPPLGFGGRVRDTGTFAAEGNELATQALLSIAGATVGPDWRTRSATSSQCTTSVQRPPTCIRDYSVAS